MKNAVRLALAVALAGSVFSVATPASACDQPPKCASCQLHPLWLIEEGGAGKPVTCYS